MNIACAALTTIAMASLCGCASSPTSGMTPEQRARVESIELLLAAPNRPFDAVGAVSGEVCHRNAFAVSDASQLNEAKVLRVQAAGLGADAVIDTKCSVVSGTSLLKNCWQVKRCTGQAIRFRGK